MADGRHQYEHFLADALLREIYISFGQDLRAYIRLKLPGMEYLIEDVLMETIRRAGEDPRALREKEDPLGWMCGVARGVCKEFVRKEWNHRKRHISLDELTFGEASEAQTYVLRLSGSESADDDLLVRELWDTIFGPTSFLTPKQQLLLGEWIEGYTADELTARHGISRQRVYNVLFACRTRIRAFVVVHWGWDWDENR